MQRPQKKRHIHLNLPNIELNSEWVSERSVFNKQNVRFLNGLDFRLIEGFHLHPTLKECTWEKWMFPVYHFSIYRIIYCFSFWLLENVCLFIHKPGQQCSLEAARVGNQLTFLTLSAYNHDAGAHRAHSKFLHSFLHFHPSMRFLHTFRKSHN